MMMTMIVAPHDPAWRRHFDEEARRLTEHLGKVVVHLHHIGSTAIPGLPAKPIIDVLMEVIDLTALDAATPALAALGYEAMGEYGIPRRRYFRKSDASGRRTHQVHAFELRTPEVERHLAFRDYMIAHPAAARAYGDLKLALALRHPDDIEAYMDGKDTFVKEHEVLAVTWWRLRRNVATTA
ncbi:MAG TPA: GrpB family protein [Thermoanaerobaculia bacterium]|nr:GrpB family protein [Thermoanaerobaculia bacterium]